MSDARLLLLSNSTNHGQGYLEHAKEPIKNFLGESVTKVLFIPFAGVRFSFDEYASMVEGHFREIGYDLESLHLSDNPRHAVQTAQAIAVGGGNTFHLVNEIFKLDVLEMIRSRVRAGVPYMGWSAGSNLACPTIKTTNDMPIVEPPSFTALRLIKFQINPHFTDAHPPGHQGETRSDRIAEFLEVNPDMTVVGLREGSILRIEGKKIELLGEKELRVFRKDKEVKDCKPGDSLQFLL